MKIGWIGTGVMGISMAGHLMKAGHELVVFNRSPDKAKPLLDAGANWCETPADVAAASEVVFTIVGYPHDVEEVYMDPEDGIFVNSSCSLVVDMTTSSPDLAVHLAKEAEKRGIQSLDAPVSGGDVGAKNGTLAIMVGGSSEAFETARPLLELLGKTMALMGPAGAGQHTKMCNQTLIASTMIGVCESLLYAERAGLDPAAVIDIIGKGAAGSWSINNLGPRIVEGDFNPGFYIEHFLKDMGIALDECQRMNLRLPGLEMVYQLYRELLASGHGRDGTQALMLALRQINMQDSNRLNS